MRSASLPAVRFTPTRVGNTRVSRRRSQRNGGSPPRVWGIPAASATVVLDVPVHPHACGEYGRAVARLPAHWRFTPTRVGNTRAGHDGRRADTVHPHACGEYVPCPVFVHLATRFTPTRVGNTPVALGTVAAGRGSPPRVWGIRVGICSWPCHFRGSPPRVWGIRNPPKRLKNLEAVHPHACGEYWAGAPLAGAISGSPPRVWGIRRRLRPAGRRPSVHPHACGEYVADEHRQPLDRRFTPTRVGNTQRLGQVSAQHVRFTPTRVGNTHVGVVDLFADARFTPTRVGNTLWRHPTPWRRTVHPHACGEYSFRPARCPSQSGSPPRVWGILSTASARWVTPSVHPHACGEYGRGRGGGG